MTEAFPPEKLNLSIDYLRAWGEVDVLVSAMPDEYKEFLLNKKIMHQPSGFSIDRSTLPAMLFDWQRDLVYWHGRKGRSANLGGCGMGKTFQQLAWASQVIKHTGGDILIVAPLAVSEQTKDEGWKLGLTVTICREQSDVKPGLNITNHDIIKHFDTKHFAGVVLDESSILKAHDGRTRQQITDAFVDTPYKLCCTATPAPNDFMELGTHAEFLNIMTRSEMLATFFVHDGGETSKWRLKGHAQKAFWKWVCSWAVMYQKPSDLGYSDEGFTLPPLIYDPHFIDSEVVIEGYLFTPDVLTLSERRSVRRSTIDSRIQMAADLINNSSDHWLVWCDLNDESTGLAKAIPGSVEVKGSDKREFKRQAAMDFAQGKTRVLVSKDSIFGFGMNFQEHCHKIARVGISDSWERMYQGDRRIWRFGQKLPVEIHLIVGEGDRPVVANIERKQRDFEEMSKGMIEHVKAEMQSELQSANGQEAVAPYREDSRSGKDWEAHLGDSIESVKRIATGSIHYSIFSVPFASLYTYSASDRDMGNSKTYEQFSEHFGFLCGQLRRVTMAGRLVSIHCMNLPTTKERDGYIGIRDFRGDIIRAMQTAGFIYHSEVCIWKDPVTAMQRTKAIGLLYKQLRKDSTISRQGIADYLVSFRVNEENQERVTKTHEGFPVGLWQRYASPVWMDINPNDTLQKESAREHNDERHICPLQLEVIERAIQLWTNPGDLVYSPFMGIGSEGYVAIRNDRRFIGCELKESYWKQACANLSAAETSGRKQPSLFDSLVEEEEQQAFTLEA